MHARRTLCGPQREHCALQRQRRCSSFLRTPSLSAWRTSCAQVRRRPPAPLVLRVVRCLGYFQWRPAPTLLSYETAQASKDATRHSRCLSTRPRTSMPQPSTGRATTARAPAQTQQHTQHTHTHTHTHTHPSNPPAAAAPPYVRAASGRRISAKEYLRVTTVAVRRIVFAHRLPTRNMRHAPRAAQCTIRDGRQRPRLLGAVRLRPVHGVPARPCRQAWGTTTAPARLRTDVGGRKFPDGLQSFVQIPPSLRSSLFLSLYGTNRQPASCDRGPLHSIVRPPAPLNV